MKKIKVYGNDNCSTCTNLKKDLEEKNIKFEYINILDNLYNLKQYLYYRDNHPGFDEYKKNQKFGIPLVVVESNGETNIYIELESADFM